jgi:hypothetical protein
MTNEEKQQLKARFFGLHIGAMIDFGSKCKSENYGLDAKAKRCLVNDSDIGFTWWPLYHCKLILRSLSSITNEEAIECARLASDGDFDNNSGILVEVDDNGVRLAAKDDDGGDIWFSISIYSTNLITNYSGFGCEDGGTLHDSLVASDWLRSKNFALPFHGLDVISEGWATLEPTNQPTQ